MFAVSLVVDRELLKETHTDGVKSTLDPVIFMPPKSFNKPFEFLLYKTNRLFSVCVYCNRSQKTLQRVRYNQ